MEEGKRQRQVAGAIQEEMAEQLHNVLEVLVWKFIITTELN